MTALLVTLWVVIGLALGVWRTDDFLRRLDAKYPRTRAHRRFRHWMYSGVVFWVVGWPVLLLVDEWSTRLILRDR